MRAFPALALCVALLPACRSADAPQSATTAAEIQEAMATHEQAQPLEGHAWLDQLVGEWSVSVGGGELEGMSFEYDERVRKIGELWVQAEGSAESFTSQLTLGYDPAKGGFVGTWIDTMQTTLWVYSGRLEEDGRALVLEAEGPHMADATKRARYRDTIRIVDADHRTLTSSMQGDDGAWTQYMSADYRRKP